MACRQFCEQHGERLLALAGQQMSCLHSCQLMRQELGLQGQAQADWGLQDQDIQKRFRLLDRQAAAASGEVMHACASIKALGQKVSSAGWRISKAAASCSDIHHRGYYRK